MVGKPIDYHDTLATAKLWQVSGGASKCELGALEPTMWKNGRLQISDLVAGLNALDFVVSMTTNGHFLEKHADALKEGGLHKLRISWHTTNPELFKDLAGGHGDYERFYQGISRAAKIGHRIAFNRVLIKGFIDDLPEQLKFISEHNLSLKLYDLMWTPQISGIYEDIFVSLDEVVEKYVLPNTTRMESIDKGIGRKRTRYHLVNGGFIEIKHGESADRTQLPCSVCEYRRDCLESFGDYARVDSNLNFYSCYMRRDIGFNLREYIDEPDQKVKSFKEQLSLIVGGEHIAESFLTDASLRFTVVPYCNFNCRVPGTNKTWCMEEPGSNSYPKLKPSTFPILKTRANKAKTRIQLV